MIRQLEITVSPQTSAANPDEYELKLAPGTLEHIRIRPAPGPNWEIYTRVLHLENAIVPDDITQWIALERQPLDFYPDFSDWGGVYKIKIQICSPQARYAHTVQYEISLAERADSAQLLERLLREGF